VGDGNRAKSFVHVIDELSIQLLLTELDTPMDFLHYLNAKEAAVRKGGLIGAGGEEDILAFYFQESSPDGYGSLNVELNGHDSWYIPEHEWRHYIESEDYYFRLSLRQRGQNWKNWIADFSDSIIDGNVGEFHDSPLLTHATVLERCASENTLSRAYLTDYYLEKYNEVPTKMRSARAVLSACYVDRGYIFLFFPWHKRYSGQDEYRSERFAYMQLYGLVARLKFPQMKEILVIGSTTRGMKGSSEAILAIDVSKPLSDLEKANAKKLMLEHSIFSNIRPNKMKDNAQNTVRPVKEFLKPGRNAKCPCNSGKKFKKCCMIKANVQQELV